MPVHFAVTGTVTVVTGRGDGLYQCGDVFDVPDLAVTHDDIVNGEVGYRHHDGRARWRPFNPRRGSTIPLARLQQRIQPPRPSISRTTCCSPTTSSMSMNSRPMAARHAGRTRTAAIPPSSPRQPKVITDPGRAAEPCPEKCRRCPVSPQGARAMPG